MAGSSNSAISSALWPVTRAAGNKAFRQSRRSGEISLRARRASAFAAQIASIPVPADGSSMRSEEHTSELQSLMRISYAVFCLKKKTNTKYQTKKPVITTRNRDQHIDQIATTTHTTNKV